MQALTGVDVDDRIQREALSLFSGALSAQPSMGSEWCVALAFLAVGD
jgi:hypothetical protein